jgi:hypothetical protein
MQAIPPAFDPQALWQELRPQLTHIGPEYPSEAVARLRAARQALAPLLVAELDAIAADPSVAVDDPDYILHLHLLTLLAEFRETRAYPAMLRIAARSEAEGEALLGDFATETMARCLASVCAGDFDPLCALADDAAVSPWLRSAALEAMVICCLEGDAAQAEVVSRIEAVGQREAERLRALVPADCDDVFMAVLVAQLCEVGGIAALPSVREWFRQDLVDTSVCGEVTEVEQDLQRSFDDCAAKMRKWNKGYLRDAEAVLSSWEMFQPKNARAPEQPEAHFVHADDGLPFMRSAPKVGRNDPCPCGSGKKFKKCCG